MREARGRTPRSPLDRNEQVRRAQMRFRALQREQGFRPVQVMLHAKLLRRLDRLMDGARKDGEALSRSELIVQLIQAGIEQLKSAPPARSRA